MTAPFDPETGRVVIEDDRVAACRWPCGCLLVTLSDDNAFHVAACCVEHAEPFADLLAQMATEAGVTWEMQRRTIGDDE